MFDRICTALSLGTLTAPPLRLSGGYTHRMYRLQTTSGDYAVKLLSPEIMRRPDALQNFAAAEGYEARLEACGLPILPARRIGGRKLHCVDGQYLYVFDCFDGRALLDGEITPAHCAKMGQVLAQIHALDCHEQPGPAVVDECLRAGAVWLPLAEALLASPDAQAEGALLRDSAPMLMQATAAMEDAIRRLPCITALCHNDMDAKNVLWRGDDFRIIDLECLGHADPLQEMLDLAVSWAGWPAEEGKFKAFVTAYREAGGLWPADAALLWDSRRNHLDWLAYNARRALLDDPEERRIGREQVHETIGKIRSDRQNRAMILTWLQETVS